MLSSLAFGQATATYTAGAISSEYNSSATTSSTSTCPATLAVTVPVGAVVTSVDVSYSVIAQGGAWMSEARSFIRCTNTGGTTEASVSLGTGNGGTFAYSRTGLTIANAVVGNVLNFQMNLFRTWGGSGCNTTYQTIASGSWSVTVNYYFVVAKDLGVISWDTPTSSCGMSSSEPVTIKVKNWGIATQNSYSLKYSTNGGTSWTSQAMTTAILPGDTLIHTFTTGANLATVGTYNCLAAVVLPLDSNTTNDTIGTTITSVAGMTLPYFDDIENWTVGTIATSGSGWIRTSATPNWEVENSTGANENSSSTGPFYDHTSEGIAGGNYIYLETSSGFGATSYLTSPCVNFGNTTAVVMKFWYHMYGAAMGTLAVEQKISGVWVSTGWSMTGQQHSSGSAAWSEATISINPAADGIRFKGISTTTYTSDMAIDDITIFVPQPNDLAMLEWTSPVSGTTPSATMPITVSVFNAGTATQDTIPIKYSIDGGTTIITEVYNDSIVPGDTLVYTFTATANMLTPGYYYCGAVVSNPGDAVGANDTVFANPYLCSSLTGNYTIGLDSTDDFNNFYDATFALANCGVSGPVTFLIDSGTYNEQVVFSSVNGASATNTITFTSASGNPDDVVLTFASPSNSSNYTLKLQGADYYRIQYITIKATAISYATVIEMKGGSDYNVFYGNKIQSTGTSSYNRGVYDYNTNNNFNTYSNNTITGGYYGMYFYGAGTTNRQNGTVVDSNDINGFYYYGLMAYYQDSITISNNYIHDGTNQYGYGIYTYYIFNDFKIINNKIVMNNSNYSYGMRVSNANYYSYASATTLPGLVANNMISITAGTGTCYGLYTYYCDDVKYYNNSVYLSAGSTTSRALYQYNTTLNTIGQSYINNIFSNTGGGYAAYFSTIATIDSLDYNNYYATGTNLAYWSGNKTDLTALQTASGKDANSVSMNPSFFANDDLRTLSIGMNNLGTPLAEVLYDFEGDVRSTTTPDLGADEYTPPANDLAVIEWLTPLTGMNTNTAATVTVKIANFGTASQTNPTVKYSIDGGATTATGTYSGTILSQDTATVTFTTTANFGTFGNYNCLAYTDLTNDQNRVNDTIFYDVYACTPLTGSYTIGLGTGSTFASFGDAVQALTACGITGSVVITADTGVFNEQLYITNIPGISATNTVTFKGSGNTTLFFESSNGTKRAVVTLDGVKHITLDSLNFVSGPAATYGWGVHLWHSADSNTIQNCNIELNNPTSSSNFNGIIASNSNSSYSTNGANASYLTLDNNSIKGGYYGIGLRGLNNSSGLAVGNKIINNTIYDYTYYGMYIYYQNAPEISGNSLTGVFAAYYGMYLYYCDNDYKVTNNTIDFQYGYGMYLYYCDGTASSRGLVANNMISQHTRNSTAYGMRYYYSKHTDIVNNSINITVGNTSGYSLYYYNSSATYAGNMIYNNNLVNTGGGYAAYIYNNTYLDSADYNNFYTTGSNFVYWQGAKANLAALQAANSNNSNSVSMDPEFISDSNLHTLKTEFKSLGTPIASVTTDIDGDIRSTTTPDIGADEFTPPPNNLGVIEVISMIDSYCGATLDSVYVIVKNFGTATQTNVPVNLVGTYPSGNISLSGVIPTIASLNIDTVYMGTVAAMASGNYFYKAYATLATDTSTANDTMTFTTDVYVSEVIGYGQDFTVWPPVNWDMTGNGSFTWLQQGGSAAYADFWSYNTGNTCEMASPAVVLPAATPAYLGFEYAYYDMTSYYVDTLEILAKSCSGDWVTIWKKGGSDLVTPGGGSTMPGTYVSDTVLLPASMQGGNVRIMFRGISDYGPNLFINNMAVFNPPVVDLGADTAVCSGDTVMLDAGFHMGATFQWTKGLTLMGTASTLDVSTPGTYICQMTQYGFTAQDAITVTFNPTPVVNFTGLATTYCDNEMAASLVGSPMGGTFTGNGVSGNMFDPAMSGLGNHDITYSFTNASGCNNFITESTMVDEAPIAVMSPDAIICEGDSATLSAGSPAVAPSLIFSQYIEGSGNNKAIEIFNVTNDTLDLADYRIAQAVNGGGWAYYHTFPAGATLAPNAVWVIVTNQVDSAIYDTTLANEVLGYPSVVHHNGDDARGIEMTEDGGTTWTLVDIIGDPDNDPGSGWNVAGVSTATKDHTLIRKSSIIEGNTNWIAVAGNDSLSSEYEVYPQNTFAGLGSHTMTVPTVPTSLIFSTYIEGSSNNKAIEIYNATSTTVNLADYRIAQATNGNGWAYYHTFPAGATLAPNAVWVMVNESVDPALYDTSSANEVLGYPSAVHHNGDDARAIEVTYDGGTTWTMIDIIGDPDNDPGSGWDVAGVSAATKDHTMVRKPNIINGSTNWSTIAGTDSVGSEYLVYAQNYFTPLDSHSVTPPTSGGATITYLWSTGATTPSITVAPNATTVYTVSVSNTNCTDIDSVVVTVNPMPIVNLGADTTIKWSWSLTLDAGNPNASWLWSTGGMMQTETFDSLNLTNGSANTVTVDVTENGCTSTGSIVITVLDDVSIENALSNVEMGIYPNPTNGEFTMTINGYTGAVNMQVIDLAGQVVYTEKLEADMNFTGKFNMQTLAKGVYYIKLSSNDGVKTHKLIIK